MKRICLLMIVFFLTAIPVAAELPSVESVVDKVEDAINAGQSGSRKLAFIVKEGQQITGEWIARAAYKKFNGETRALMVILEPENLKGTGHIFFKEGSKAAKQWVYYPTTRRVRELSRLTIYESFLGTDFTHADFGLQDPGGTHKILGEETRAGEKTYKLENVPKEKWFYSKIISWVSIETYLPIQHDYYDSTGRLWKTKLFENIVTVNNVPIPLRVRMIDVQRNRSTEILISDVCYDADYLTKEDFNPEKLPTATLSPVCKVRPVNKKE